jgi:hypothetical protein
MPPAERRPGPFASGDPSRVMSEKLALVKSDVYSSYSLTFQLVQCVELCEGTTLFAGNSRSLYGLTKTARSLEYLLWEQQCTTTQHIVEIQWN